MPHFLKKVSGLMSDIQCLQTHVLVEAVVVLSDDGGEARNVGPLPHGVYGHDEVHIDVMPLADLRECPLSEGLPRQELYKDTKVREVRILF